MALSKLLRVALGKFFAALKELLANKQPDLAISSDQYSCLTRFIFQKGHFSKIHGKPKPNAFLPKPPFLKISAIWKDRLAEHEIWQIGDSVGEGRSKPPQARADFDVAAVSEAKLKIEPDTVPHPRHINICEWPVAKDEQKSIAILLCKRATLHLRELEQ